MTQTPHIPRQHQPDEPFMLQQMAPKKKRRIWPLMAIAAVLALGSVGFAGYALTREATPPARVIDGIAAPHPKCVNDVQDFGHPWIADGWWAGRVDGVPREMSSQAAMASSLAGKTMEGVWLCPPKRDW